MSKTHSTLTKTEREMRLEKLVADMGEELTVSRDVLTFFVDSIRKPSPGWEVINRAMFSTSEGTAWDDAAAAIGRIRILLRRVQQELQQ